MEWRVGRAVLLLFERILRFYRRLRNTHNIRRFRADHGVPPRQPVLNNSITPGAAREAPLVAPPPTHPPNSPPLRHLTPMLSRALPIAAAPAAVRADLRAPAALRARAPRRAAPRGGGGAAAAAHPLRDAVAMLAVAAAGDKEDAFADVEALASMDDSGSSSCSSSSSSESSCSESESSDSSDGEMDEAGPAPPGAEAPAPAKREKRPPVTVVDLGARGDGYEETKVFRFD
jgi:hypothetical protein